jgi:very-short-patch-repair endonuclease
MLRVVDRAIAELAERQHGVVGRRQLGVLGIGKGAIEGRLMRGQLHRVQRGVYAVGHKLVTQEGRWMAAVISAGSDAVLSHRSAGELWQVLPGSRGPIELTRPTVFRSRPGIRGHSSSLPPDEVTVVDRIPVTSIARTLLDLAPILSRHQLERAFNEGEVQRIHGRLSVPDLLDRYPRRRGSAVLRAILAEEGSIRGITRRQLEERFAVVLSTTGLPRPRLNADLAVRGRFFQVDCLWSEQRLIVELDGRAVHGTRRAFEKDRERDRLLQSEGWRVVRITWRQLKDDEPAVIADLRRMLRPEPSPPTL